VFDRNALIWRTIERGPGEVRFDLAFFGLVNKPPIDDLAVL
jgi:hypothetical protein